MIIELQKYGQLYDLHTQQQLSSDVKPAALLFKPCQIAQGVTLRDIFCYLSNNNNLDFFNNLLPTHCAQLVTRGLQCGKLEEKSSDESNSNDPYPLIALELDWRMELEAQDDRDQCNYGTLVRTPLPNGHIRVELTGPKRIVKFPYRTLTGTDSPCLHGVMLEPPQTQEPQQQPQSHTHEEQHVGLDMTSLEEIIDLPLRLKHLSPLSMPTPDNPSHEEQVQVEFTLLQILQGIVWELSFFGAPASKDEFIQDMIQRLTEHTTGDHRDQNRVSGDD